MIRVDQVRARIEEMVPAIAGRLGNAADFANVVKTKSYPQVTPAGMVMFGGIEAAAADVITGMFRQSFNETSTIILMDRVSGDPRGVGAVDRLTPLIVEVVTCLAGWEPAGAMGPFQLISAGLIGISDGVLQAQIEMGIPDQLRIAT